MHAHHTHTHTHTHTHAHAHTHTHTTHCTLTPPPSHHHNRDQILKHISHQEVLKQRYAEELTKATSEQKQYSPQSLEVRFVKK